MKEPLAMSAVQIDYAKPQSGEIASSAGIILRLSEKNYAIKQRLMIVPTIGQFSSLFERAQKVSR
jgi:hypothetical protein